MSNLQRLSDLTEKNKMLANMHYEHLDNELTSERAVAANLLYKFNNSSPDEHHQRAVILQDLLGNMGSDCEIKQPFQCDYGYNLKLGDRVFMNYGCVILDCNEITIGSDTLLAPGVQISAAYHPVDPQSRLEKLEAAAAIKIGSNVWIGANAVICPGVSIGNNTTIGAGSVVTKDIPADVIAVGSPCKVIRNLNK